MLAPNRKYSKHLNSSNLINKIFKCFGKIKDVRKNKSPIPFSNFLMSSFAMMHKNYDSFMRFENDCAKEAERRNLEKKYHIEHGIIPSANRTREVVDCIDTSEIINGYKEILSDLQRNGILKSFEFKCGNLKNYYLMPIDGTGIYYSKKCSCKNCCIKNKGKSNESYYHGLIGGCIAHPDQKTVIPFAPEAIIRQDGNTKNDYEKNAIKRYLARLKRDHPRLKLIILLDGLYADNPTIALIRKYGWHYIIVAKDDNHEALIEAVNNLYDQAEVHHHEIIDEETKATHQFRFANNFPLNLQDQTEMVNVLDYIEFGKDGHILRYWSWVTDIELTNETVKDVMIGGRTRWSIENESFNTLKNKGYHLEHNYGHGKKIWRRILPVL